MKTRLQPWGFALAATVTALGLSACGGDDAAPVVAAPASTTFSGTAATGAALAGATVTITCAAGSGSATTAANGSYSTSITSVTLPCALKAESADHATVLFSITTTAATSAQVANITPLTQLLVASLAGTDPAAFFAGFNATTAATVTPAAVTAAQAAVLTTLSNAGVNTTGLTDLVGGALVGGSGSGYDGVLDAVHTLLTSTGTTLAQLATTVATNSPAAPATSNNHEPSLPASLLLRTAAANCKALRSGDYVSINPQKGLTLADQIGTSTFNASNLTWTDADGSTGSFTANGDCAYTDNGDDYVVSQAGVVMGVNSDQPVAGLTLIFPKQTIAVADLAGSWNALGFEKTGNAYVAQTVTADISSSGAFTNLVECVGAGLNATCTTSTTTINLSANSAGGFDWVGSGTNTWTERAFAYRAGSGDLMLVTLGGGGSINVWTKQRTLGLNPVGTVNPAGWFVRVNNQLASTGPVGASYTSTIKSVDTATVSYVRTQNTSTGVADYDETIVQNSPRAGFNFRAAAPSTVSVFDSRTVNVRERTSLGIRGMGVSFQSVPSQSAFQMSVDK